MTILHPRNIVAAMGGVVTGRDSCKVPGPGHSPKDLSVSVRWDPAAPDGFVVHSFAGDDPLACKDLVREKMGCKWEPARKDDPVGRMNDRASKPRGKLVATYDYTAADGKLLYQSVRFDPKDFRQRRPDGRGGWIWNVGERRVLYRLPDLLKFPDATVFVCEGEKDADRLASLGYCATTVAGDGKWTDDCIGPLKGRDIFVLEDNDKAGRKRALKAATALQAVVASLRIVQLPGLAEGGDVSDWLDANPSSTARLIDICLGTPEWKSEDSHEEIGSDLGHDDRNDRDTGPFQGEQPKADQNVIEIFWHGKNYNRPPRSWLAKDLIPETGNGLLAGQWGTAKTFAALDLSASTITQTPFAGRPTVRKGGVLFIAAEGANEIPIRLQGLVDHKLAPMKLAAAAAGDPIDTNLEALPFGWIEECPNLKEGFDRIVALSQSAASYIKEQFGLPLALIIVDTLNAAANFKDGNDAAEGQFIMNRLNELSRKTGAFVLAVDHFGKAVETGTRGTSAKEAAADVVLALLAERDIAGNIRSTRMAVRKLRGGSTGAETPFDLKVVDIGDGETTCIIEWKQGAQEGRKTTRWPKSTKILKAALLEVLSKEGKDCDPFGDGKMKVKTVSASLVRAEFMKRYPADTIEPSKQADAKRKAFVRSMKAALDGDLIGSREIEGVDHLWLVEND